ncbi:MAG: dihydroneopterin aldolase [Bacteroidales bacterium]|nr:dihydroneopterin aldolase [Bacteroidales bacterium]
MGTIKLDNLRFYAYHGCLESEKVNGNWFVVTIEYTADIEAAACSDALEDSVDYAAIYNIAAEEMKIPSNLIEHVAGRIISRIKETFAQIASCSVTVTKENPPFEATSAGHIPCPTASVTLSY